MRKVLASITGLTLLLSSTAAFAQGDAPAPAEPLAPPPAPPPTVSVAAETSTPATSTASTTARADDGQTDHEKVIHKFGVGYFGVSQIPIGQGPVGGVNVQQVSAPVIGMRYWLQERMGIDAGLGFNFFSSARSTEVGNTTTDTDGPAVIALALHVGLPLAFAYGKHYKFLAVPELNFGYATQTVAAQNVTPAPPDVHYHGLRLDVGGRVGTEIQFGFIGIPELALQASVGLNFRYQSWGASQDQINGPPVVPATSSSGHSMGIGTTVQSDPWALFTNNISAIYYFP